MAEPRPGPRDPPPPAPSTERRPPGPAQPTAPFAPPGARPVSMMPTRPGSPRLGLISPWPALMRAGCARPASLCPRRPASPGRRASQGDLETSRSLCSCAGARPGGISLLTPAPYSLAEPLCDSPASLVLLSSRVFPDLGHKPSFALSGLGVLGSLNPNLHQLSRAHSCEAPSSPLPCSPSLALLPFPPPPPP